MEAQQARARRPPLMIVTNIAQQQTSAKRINAAVFPHSSISHGLLKTRTLSSSSTCVISPSSSCAAAPMAPPPAPSMVRTANQRNNTPMSTPTASARSRGSKYCSDPDCASPMAADAVSSKGSHPRPASAPVGSGPHVSPMSTDTYFKLLKKSQVLEHLVQLSSHVGESEQRVRRLQCEQARSQCVQDRVFAELERYRRQVVDAQQQFLGLIESLTTLCLREEHLQACSADDSEPQNPVSAEEQTFADLQRASSPTSRSSSTSGGLTLETQALTAVGRQRAQQLETICARYERQLVGSEAALSQAIYSDAARESAAKIAQLEARNLQHEADKKALEIQLELARGQASHLQDQLTLTQERRTTLEHVRTFNSGLQSSLETCH
jgi:hypothetical protein